jgi:hypothetical protein
MINLATCARRVSVVALGGLAALMPGRPADACGGLFCNQPQNTFDPPPVAQTAENVLFAMSKDAAGVTQLEAHVQIFYAGPADRFSWVVPVDDKPELDVGTNQLFKVLDPATRPTFELNWKEEGTCLVPPPNSVGEEETGGAGGFGTPGSSATGGSTGGVDVSFRGDIGPYDAAVIRSTDPNDPKPLKEWLATNSYYLSPEGGTLIDDYVREGKYFVAIRLINGHSVNEIQPLVMRFAGESPCVPIRLTSVAAINDLRINLWVLNEHRIVPSNYLELVVNPARIDWFQGGQNYDALVKQAANQAGGNAFVTDFVGPASVMRGRIYAGGFDVIRLSLAKTPPEAMNEITAQGFPRDAALLEILRKHIPEPQALQDQGVSELQFYNQLAFYWMRNQALFAPFSAEALAADVDARLVQPLTRTQALFDRFPKLTRLSTFISPEEMSVDPLFMANSTLPDVPTRRVATAVAMCGHKQYTRCGAPVRLELPDGQELFFTRAEPTDPSCEYYSELGLDRGRLDQMPALQVAWQRESIGEGAARMNNGPEIESDIAAHNYVARKAIARAAKSGGCSIGGIGGGGAVALLGLAVALLARRRSRR